jgi:hypothetical protein
MINSSLTPRTLQGNATFHKARRQQFGEVSWHLHINSFDRKDLTLVDSHIWFLYLVVSDEKEKSNHLYFIPPTPQIKTLFSEGLGFELGTLHLQRRCSTTSATSSVHFCLVILEMVSCKLFALPGLKLQAS